MKTKIRKQNKNGAVFKFQNEHFRLGFRFPTNYYYTIVTTVVGKLLFIICTIANLAATFLKQYYALKEICIIVAICQVVLAEQIMIIVVTWPAREAIKLISPLLFNLVNVIFVTGYLIIGPLAPNLFCDVACTVETTLPP